MMKRVVLIPGDGIGPEVIGSCVRVINATDADIEFIKIDAGESAIEREGTPLPENVLNLIRKYKVALKGPITTPIGSGFRSVNVELRKRLDLYANIRPAKSFDGIKTRYENVDLVVIRENTEGLYVGIERYTKNESEGETIRRITKRACERIVRFAFEYAIKENRKKVTAVHKANIMKVTDGIFLNTAKEVAEEYPDIEFEDKIVDNMCMQLVTRPELYDVIVTTNMFGDIISDLCAGLVGGLGVAPGANLSEDIAVFEPVHGSAPKYAGLDKVNPTATILSGVMMLRHIGEEDSANKIMNALIDVFKEGKKLTFDLGGSAKTSEFTEYLVSKIRD
ncbi:MAG: NAD-dependent isocitrate dehydrogenase [Candidatus Altiarchaeales archaeon]|nr:MAG: NAD-dependent isocitrate dehydrogenase [Candidatus Altiarchaeales archaeon]RLI95616.1 MAG: NAD-dependent isocitrate dehydrogenase [Candidatus Altiarchaeales archaeon]HDO82757.1 isocitrate/isopropylmalate dehydrogenase family protein [Candidatus Altiarchaeales archaeon]HEX55406.1 isocitrate/isopropylmalate dehydrogenase family protein [Candidatus Altiarchaeales archaeon]